MQVYTAVIEEERKRNNLSPLDVVNKQKKVLFLFVTQILIKSAYKTVNIS